MSHSDDGLDVWSGPFPTASRAIFSMFVREVHPQGGHVRAARAGGEPEPTPASMKRPPIPFTRARRRSLRAGTVGVAMIS